MRLAQGLKFLVLALLPEGMVETCILIKLIHCVSWFSCYLNTEEFIFFLFKLLTRIRTTRKWHQTENMCSIYQRQEELRKKKGGIWKSYQVQRVMSVFKKKMYRNSGSFLSSQSLLLHFNWTFCFLVCFVCVSNLLKQNPLCPYCEHGLPQFRR